MGSLKRIEDQIKGLQDMRDDLAELIANCETSRNDQQCPIMRILNVTNSSGSGTS